MQVQQKKITNINQVAKWLYSENSKDENPNHLKGENISKKIKWNEKKINRSKHWKLIESLFSHLNVMLML